MTIHPFKGAREAPRSERSRMQTLLLTPEETKQWKIPPFQRPLRINDKVRLLAEQIKSDENIPGVITIGHLKLKNESEAVYIVDGQHRIEAFNLSGVSLVTADVRAVDFTTMAEMADEFVLLNSSLVRMRPDDVLRGLEASTPALSKIRKACNFVGYDQIRRSSTTSPVVGMSALLRCWNSGSRETPSGAAGGSAASLAQNIDDQSVSNLITFLAVAYESWGRDPEFYRLWANLNLTLCMWMWRKLVIDRERPGSKRYLILNIPEFKSCLMAVSAKADYSEWLVNRNLSDRDRSPCYARLKSIFVRRLSEIKKDKKILLPQPEWASN
jgi:hypothetical protein